MHYLNYAIPVLLREAIVPSRSAAGRQRRDACRRIAEGEEGDLKAGFSAARYATFTWFAIAVASLLFWLVLLMVLRYAFSLTVFDSMAAQIPLRIVFGVGVASMIQAGLVMIKSPGAYVIKGKLTYIARKHGPNPVDFWVGLAVGAIAAIAL